VRSAATTTAGTAHRVGFPVAGTVFGALGGLLWARLRHLVLHRDFVSVTGYWPAGTS
jgi:hypothetical protein